MFHLLTIGSFCMERCFVTSGLVVIFFCIFPQDSKVLHQFSVVLLQQTHNGKKKKQDTPYTFVSIKLMLH